MSNNLARSGEPRIQLSDNDRELLESSKNVKLFTFSKSPVEPTLDFPSNLDQRKSLINSRNNSTIRQPSTSGTFDVSDSSRTLAEVTKLIERKSSRPFEQEAARSTQPTVEELMKALSKRSNFDESSTMPPPVPPKPKSHCSVETNKSPAASFIEQSFRRYRSSNISSQSTHAAHPDTLINAGRALDNSYIQKSKSNRSEYEPPARCDNDVNEFNATFDISNRPEEQRAKFTSKLSIGTQDISRQYQQGLFDDTPRAKFAQPQRDSHVDKESQLNYLDERSKNIVQTRNMSKTEPHDEQSNYETYSTSRNLPQGKSSTVEILEVPNKPSNTYLHTDAKHRNSRSREQLYFENNNCITADPVITSPTDDEEEDFNRNTQTFNNLRGKNKHDDAQNVLITQQTLDLQPPRTSTPSRFTSNDHDIDRNPSSQLRANHTVIGLGGDDIGIERPGDFHSSSASQIRNLFQRVQNELASQDRIEDILDISKDTDELTNTSALNQSGGCELVGLDENSGENSRDLTKADSTRKPYMVELNETEMNSPDSNEATTRKSTDKFRSNGNDPSQSRIEELERLTKSLCLEVNSLKSQVSELNSKIEEIPSSSELRAASFLEPSANIQSVEPFPNLIHGLSKSSSTINKYSTPSSNRQANLSMQPTNTSHRNIATISRTPNPNISSHNLLTTRSSLQAPGHTSTITKFSRKPNINESTSSLYADSLRSDCTSSTSPIPNNQQHQLQHQQMNQISSSRSYMSLTNKRDPKSYSSMMSLSTAGTLKKDQSTIANGSVTNLTVAESQISSWPSTSDFVAIRNPAKEVMYYEEERLIKMVLFDNLITMKLPSWIDDNYNIEKIKEPPLVRLKLDWVYGYRGKDCRCNLYYLPTGECVYFVASIVVLYDPENSTQRHYLGHTDSVKCIAVHPNKLVVASGQSASQDSREKRPIVRVWDTVSLATLKVIGFNEDYDRPICCLAFSKHDYGATLAVVDESSEHTITLLDWQRDKNWRLAEANSGHDAVLAIDFHPIDKYTLVAVGKSGLNFWDIRGMTMSKRAGLFDKYSKPKYVLCLTFSDLGDTITGDSNGNIMIWPKGANRPSRVIHEAHQGGVFSIISMRTGTYLTGGRDRRVVEWDEEFNTTGREAKLPEHCGGVRYITYARGSQVLIGTLRNCILLGSLDKNFNLIMQGHSEATTSLAIHPNQQLYLTGGYDEQVHLFDAETHQTHWSECLQMPIRAACFSPNGEIIVIGSTQGKWVVFDTVNRGVLFSKCDGSGVINCIKFSPKGDYFAMGSSDSHLYVYQVSEGNSKFLRIGTCGGHSSPIKEVDWSDDGYYLQSQSVNFELLFWKASTCKLIEDLELIANLTWSTHNCSLGFNVFGIWSDSLDPALIQNCDRSNANDLIVSTTSNGYINLFKWPADQNHCLSQRYFGNVERFNLIKFLPDDSKIVTIDTKNCVTTEWIVEKTDINS